MCGTCAVSKIKSWNLAICCYRSVCGVIHVHLLSARCKCFVHCRITVTNKSLAARRFSRFRNFQDFIENGTCLEHMANVCGGYWFRQLQYWSLLNWHNLRLHCGGVEVPVNWFMTLFHNFSLTLRTLYIVWSLMRHRVTRRLTRLQTMCNVLKYCKIL